MNTQTQRIAAIAALVLTALALIAAAPKAPEGVSGSIFFRDGRIVEFQNLGGVDQVWEYVIYGKMGMQDVQYKFSEIAQIQLPNKHADYKMSGGSEAIIVSRTGEHFTLSDVYFKRIQKSDLSILYYVYADPVTNTRRLGQDAFRDIAHIELGDHTGRWKHNPKNNDYFPSNYNFDPFTGDKLEWTDEPQPSDEPADP